MITLNNQPIPLSRSIQALPKVLAGISQGAAILGHCFFAKFHYPNIVLYFCDSNKRRYTGDFEATWQDVSEGCKGLLEYLTTKH